MEQRNEWRQTELSPAEYLGLQLLIGFIPVHIERTVQLLFYCLTSIDLSTALPFKALEFGRLFNRPRSNVLRHYDQGYLQQLEILRPDHTYEIRLNFSVEQNISGPFSLLVCLSYILNGYFFSNAPSNDDEGRAREALPAL